MIVQTLIFRRKCIQLRNIFREQQTSLVVDSTLHYSQHHFRPSGNRWDYGRKKWSGLHCFGGLVGLEYFSFLEEIGRGEISEESFLHSAKHSKLFEGSEFESLSSFHPIVPYVHQFETLLKNRSPSIHYNPSNPSCSFTVENSNKLLTQLRNWVRCL